MGMPAGMLHIGLSNPIDICGPCQAKPITALAEFMDRRGYNRAAKPHGW
jgi:hypothetical protein